MMTSTMLRETLGNAAATFDGELLTVQTGKLTRIWRWTGRGFLTQSVSLGEDKTWKLDNDDDRESDWLLPVCEDNNPDAVLSDVTIAISDDEGFTSEHLAVTAEMEYPEAKLALRFVIWAYPDVAGLRTALQLKALDGFAWDGTLHKHETTDASLQTVRLSRGYQRHDLIPVDFSGTSRRVFGYYADTQQRNDPAQDLLLESVSNKPLTHPEVCDWSNAMCVEDDSWGIALLKESHKCANQKGHDTGAFLCLPGRGLESHGWGITPTEIDSEWRPTWANWCVAYAANDRARQQAFKTFDQHRYPVRERDVYVQANTWGSSQGYLEHRDAAGEANVLREIDSCADLGIDILQIDDGWQGNQYETWTPVADRYPNGWAPVRTHAAEKNVQLGLWLAALPPSLEDLDRNADDGGFVSYKLDFAVLKSRHQIDALMNKVRAFVKGRNHGVRVNWDLTEVAPRYGYYFAREFGCIYLENRKPVWPRSVTYRPGTVLRDLWQLSHYCNLLKFQGSVQNIDRVDRLYSDAAAYNHAYCVAITLMSSPLFFCETHFYDEAARQQIRPLLAAYKTVRHDIFRGTIHPIGNRPDGTQWTGFECALPEGDKGVLTIFREPWNEDKSHTFVLPDCAGKSVVFKDLLTAAERTADVDAAGRVEFTIPDAADFRFLTWRTV